MNKHIGYLNGIEIRIGERYLIDNEMWELVEYFNLSYKFENVLTRRFRIITEGDLMRYCLSSNFEKGAYIKIPRMHTGFISNDASISNDLYDSIQYTLQSFWNDKQKPQLKVYFNDKKKATTLIDGDKVVVVKTKKGEKYNRRIGFLEAYFELKSGMSKTQKNKYLEGVVEDEQ